MATRPAEGGSGYRLEPTRLGDDRAAGSRRFVGLAAAVVAAIGIVALWPDSSDVPANAFRPAPSASAPAVAVASEPAPSEGPRRSRRREREPQATAFPEIALRTAEPPRGTVLLLDGRETLREIDLATGRGRWVAGDAEVLDVLADGRVALVDRREPWSRVEHRIELGYELLDPAPARRLLANRSSTLVIDGVRPEGARRAFRPVSTAAVADPAGRWVAVAWASRDASGTWRAGVDILGLAPGVAGGRTVLGTIDGAPEGAYQSVTVGVRRDGGALVVTSPVVATSAETMTQRGEAWLVDVVDGSPRRSAPVRLAPLDAGVTCQDIVFVGPERIVERCVGGSEGTEDRLVYQPYDLAGNPEPALTVPDFRGARRAVHLIDQERGVAFAWDSIGPAIARVDVAGGSVDVVDHAPELDPVVWQNQAVVDRDSAAVISSDGRRLFVVGGRIDERRRIRSTGIWAFDTATLELVDRWALPTLPVTLALTSGGRYLLAGAPPGITSDGDLAGYEASVAVYDVDAADEVAILGRLGQSRTLVLHAQPLPDG